MKEGPHNYKIAGGTDKQKEAASEFLTRTFEVESAEIRSIELPKSSEEIETIQIADVATDDVIRECGAVPRPFTLDNVCIVPQNGVRDLSKYYIQEAGYFPTADKVVVDRTDQNFVLAWDVAHELLHAKSTKGIRIIDPDSGEYAMTKSGLRTAKKGAEIYDIEDRTYFSVLEEAIVSELSRRTASKLIDRYFSPKEIETFKRFKSLVTTHMGRSLMPKKEISMINEEIAFMKIKQEDMEKIEYSGSDDAARIMTAMQYLRSNSGTKYAFFTERAGERFEMNKFLDSLVLKSKGKIKDREEVFRLFVQANYSGNYLQVARLVESILGKGSFRKIAVKFGEKLNT